MHHHLVFKLPERGPLEDLDLRLADYQHVSFPLDTFYVRLRSRSTEEVPELPLECDSRLSERATSEAKSRLGLQPAWKLMNTEASEERFRVRNTADDESAIARERRRWLILTKVGAGAEARSHDCERCTQDCVRHGRLRRHTHHCGMYIPAPRALQPDLTSGPQAR
jgi:hypothetical protein